MFKVGDVKRFLSPKNDRYEIKEVIEDPNISISYDFDGGICPDCKKKCKIKKDYSFKRIYILENNKGEIGYKGETSDGELVRMPDDTFNVDKKQDMDEKIRKKSEYLKEK